MQKQSPKIHTSPWRSSTASSVWYENAATLSRDKRTLPGVPTGFPLPMIPLSIWDSENKNGKKLGREDWVMWLNVCGAGNSKEGLFISWGFRGAGNFTGTAILFCVMLLTILTKMVVKLHDYHHLDDITIMATTSHGCLHLEDVTSQDSNKTRLLSLIARQWYHAPLIPAGGRGGCCEFKASLVCRATFKIGELGLHKVNSISKNKQKVLKIISWIRNFEASIFLFLFSGFDIHLIF